MKRSILYAIIGVLVVVVIALSVMQFVGGGNQAAAPVADVEGLGDAAAALVAERGLTSENVYAALKTYMPSGQHDPYMMFASGGHSGQIHVIGVPSMRILRTIGVFAPEPWQGYGYGEAQQEVMFEEGDVLGAGVRWGDTHHPALSETDGMYDGEFVFINDKAQARVAVVDLRDFETKQLVKNPINKFMPLISTVCFCQLNSFIDCHSKRHIDAVNQLVGCELQNRQFNRINLFRIPNHLISQ